MTKIWPALLAFLAWSIFAILIHEFLNNHLLGDCAIPHVFSESTIANSSTINSVTDSETSVIKSLTSNQNTHKSENSSSDRFIISAQGKPAFTFDKGFSISANDGSIKIPKELNGFKDSIYSYLNKHQDKELVITAKYLASEVNIKKGIHLGNARIEHLKNSLSQTGINPDKIVSTSVEAMYSYNDKGTYNDGISIHFQDIGTDRIAEVEKGIANKTLYSNFAVREFLPDRTLQAYTLELINYIKKYPGKKIYLEGHTDSVGENNYQFGFDRANLVKDYLILQGLPSAIILVSSKGETEPIASNKTESGRAKNRRVEITVK